ncbi:hypothetical protein Pst134EA_015461 [Puccinia striiformis f. sp. tritici]|uniref:hypothetical protein n=1 Tax=Puccinia striiformis f. sp. tritici TaxID=168172 RepID=UPI0020083D7E|nr:hypothetical protein Pst134EA_015461 [Puccinia striiformis f. sp. tritici]KAH9463374.1 hypothetical protein Pst134EA_015461 [Puccinia striiformis f. sp. tritici]
MSGNTSPNMNDTESNDVRVEGYEPLISPLLLRSEVPISQRSWSTIRQARRACSKVISHQDDRLIVIVGPCSIHDTEQAMEYAKMLLPLISELPELVIVMRSYFEKPRTIVGWKGLINDPDLDGSFKINKGMRKARQLLSDLTDLGIPVGVELLDTISPQFLSDLISWGAIGARTTESQLHRELASGTSHPIGFKNATDGGVSVAIDAMRSSNCAHSFLGVNEQGLASIVKTKGNSDVHVILRGGRSQTNFDSQSVSAVRDAMVKARPDVPAAIMIDCSHGNSLKDHRNQPKVVSEICKQLEAGDRSIVGVMIESHINEGRQDLPAEGPVGLKHGVSITDACIDFQTTVKALKDLQAAVIARRKITTNGSSSH